MMPTYDFSQITIGFDFMQLHNKWSWPDIGYWDIEHSRLYFRYKDSNNYDFGTWG